MSTKSALAPAAAKARDALDLIMRIRNVSDIELAAKLDVGHHRVFKRRNGQVALSLDDITAYADALDVPERLFREDVPTILRWFADRTTPGGDVRLFPYSDNLARRSTPKRRRAA